MNVSAFLAGDIRRFSPGCCFLVVKFSSLVYHYYLPANRVRVANLDLYVDDNATPIIVSVTAYDVVGINPLDGSPIPGGKPLMGARLMLPPYRIHAHNSRTPPRYRAGRPLNGLP